MFIHFHFNLKITLKQGEKKMKIEKVVLRNFSAIANAMKTNELTIDFSTAKNNICLIIGPNGSGKTTLMSLLTPFSDLGNLDIRNGNELILEDKEGYKEIDIIDGEDEYILKHFYSPHKGKNHSVKSYIMKNGIELNINGNVSSFKEYVKEELGIDIDYLKLIRLGNNVTSLIDLTETERKNFMSKLLDEIGVSLAFYKKVNNDLRQLKQMITINSDKIRKLGIDDLDIIEDEIKKYNNLLEEARVKYDKINNQISIYRHEIETIEDKETLKDRLNGVIRKVKKMEKILDKKEELPSTNVEYYVTEIDKLTIEKIRINDKLSSMENMIHSHLEQLDQYEEELREVNVEIQKENDSDKELEKMKEEYCKLRADYSYRSSFLETYEYKFSKKEYDSFVVSLKNIQQILGKTYEFGKKPIKKVLELVRKNQNVMQYVNSNLMNLYEEAEEENSNILRILSTRFDFRSDINCKETCPAKSLWSQIQLLLEDRNQKDKHNDFSFFKDVESCYLNLSEVIHQLSDLEEIIKLLPEKVRESFRMENIYKKIEKMEVIYDDKDINNILSQVTEYASIKDIENKMEELDKEIKRFEKIGNSKYLNKQKEKCADKINSLSEDLVSLKTENNELIEKLKEITNSIETLDELHEALSEYDSLKELMNQLNTLYELYKTDLSLISTYNRELDKVNNDIKNYTKNIQSYEFGKTQYVTLRSEMDKYSKIYDEMNLVKESLSSKKGIPLYHIKQYFGNTEEITNELLDIAYDGQIYIDKFHITPTEFQIPYYIRGKKMKDVKYASQGEISFLSIALSFGLSSQSFSKYNIMLLDEIDGALDNKNREKFIKILENQIERIGSEQNFLITHNNMFSSYPVDIIDLSFGDRNTEYELANYIRVIRQ